MSGENYKALGDPELVGLCLKGDSRAWETLILRYRRLIYSIPVKFNFGTADASDVFQAVCLKLIEHLHELKDESKVSAWLITTTTRQCIHVRAHPPWLPAGRGRNRRRGWSGLAVGAGAIAVEARTAMWSPLDQGPNKHGNSTKPAWPRNCGTRKCCEDRSSGCCAM